MAQRGRPKNLEKQIEETSAKMRELVSEKWRKKARAEAEALAEVLTDEQFQAIRKAQIALGDFVQEFSDDFDIDLRTARKLQRAYYALRGQFSHYEEE